jgi:hypothetical protein
MDLDELVKLPYYEKGIFKHIMGMAKLAHEGEYTGLVYEKLPLGFRDVSQVLYYQPNAKL